jgi:hypothetical protein
MHELSSGSVEIEADRSETFAPAKILVSVNARGARGPELRILHAQDSFYAAFRYSPRDLPMFLSSLVSEANDRGKISALELALITGGDLTLNLILRDKFSQDVSCQLSIAAGCAVTAVGQVSNRPVAGRVTVVTIRSARVTEGSIAIDLMVQAPLRASVEKDCDNGGETVSKMSPKKQKSCAVPCDVDEDAA